MVENTITVDFSRLHDPIDFYAQRQSARLAVESPRQNFTYGELLALQNAIACALQGAGLGPQARIGVFVEDLAWAYPAIVGAFKIGSIYVPLNADFPDQRLRDIAEDADLGVICCQDKCLERAKGLAKNLPLCRFLILDAPNPCDAQINAESSVLYPVFHAVPYPEQRDNQDIAYLMYTSGTTGKPKGVMVPHKAVVAFLKWALAQFKLGPEDRFSQHSRLSFDLSIFDIFAAFFCGGTLVPIERKADLAFPGNFLIQNKISICLSVPGVLGMMDRAGQLKQDFKVHLRYYLVCGEALSPAHAARWIETQTQIPLYNLYGPTEATVACSYQWVTAHDIGQGAESISIGRAMTGSELLVLKDDFKTPCAEGEVGHLMLAGQQLSLGYWHREDLTQAVFIPHPNGREWMYKSGDLAKQDAEGRFHWMGRADQQVNINGYRVELMEIEALISKMPEFSDCAVVAWGKPLALQCIAVVHGAMEPYTTDLLHRIAEHCGHYLPDYMIPRKLMLKVCLPRNANGKIDRKALVGELQVQVQNHKTLIS